MFQEMAYSQSYIWNVSVNILSLPSKYQFWFKNWYLKFQWNKGAQKEV